MFFLINHDFYKGQRKDKDSSLADSLSTSIFLNFYFLFVNTFMVMLECFLNIYPKDKMTLKNERAVLEQYFPVQLNGPLSNVQKNMDFI